MSNNPELETVLKNIPDAIYFKNGDGEYIKVSESLKPFINIDDGEEIEGKSDFDLFYEEDAQEMYEEDLKVIEKNKPIIGKEKKIRKADGEKIWIRAHKFPYRDSNGKLVGTFGVLKKIEDEKDIEKELRTSKEQAKLMAEKSGNIIYRIDRDFNCIYANQKAISFFGKGKEEVIGSKISKILSDEKEEKFREKVEKVLETGEGVELEHKWDDPPRWLFSVFSPIPDPETGEIEDIIVTSRDITRAKEAEKRQEFLHSLLRHDLRNKIQIIQGYLQFLEDTDVSEDQKEYLNKAIKATRNGYDLIEEVRDLRKTEQEQKILEVNVGAMIRKVINDNIERAEEKDIEIKYERKDLTVGGGPLLRPLFENLILNGVQHSGGEVVNVWMREENGKVRVVVEDDGKGIVDKNKSKIFDQSWSGKDSRGSGLGLHLVKKITETYGGDVDIKDSELGGARFDVLLEKAQDS